MVRGGNAACGVHSGGDAWNRRRRRGGGTVAAKICDNEADDITRWRGQLEEVEVKAATMAVVGVGKKRSGTVAGQNVEMWYYYYFDNPGVQLFGPINSEDIIHSISPILSIRINKKSTINSMSDL